MNLSSNSSVRIPLLQLQNISMQWHDRRVLSDISLAVFPGDFMAITGPNGGGKTTLLRIMLRLLKPTSGNVIYGVGLKSNAIGYLPQKNMIDSHFPITVHEVVASGLLASGLPASEVRDKVGAMLRTVGLTEQAGSSIGQLSGGQLQRALLGRAMISEPSLLVLDEPLSYIDKRFEHQLYDILASVARTTTIVLVSHEMTAISEMANRHIIVDNGIHECTAAHHYVRSDCE
ncbi:MAG: ATP-binding cassette domain-containing protein [Muribaculaceae bacterium]|nr:ATP-binding cassette domain-containing protein [Muribaculaceae bacterium]